MLRALSSTVPSEVIAHARCIAVLGRKISFPLSRLQTWEITLVFT
jgi:hypothetical protein